MNIMVTSTFSGLQRCRWQYGSIFIRLAVVASHICEIPRNDPKIRTYSSSRSSKVIDLGANRKCICNFLLVINSNFGLSPTVLEIDAFSLKIACFRTPPLFDDPSRGTPSDVNVIYTLLKSSFNGLQFRCGRCPHSYSYLHSTSRCWLRNLQNAPKIPKLRENSNSQQFKAIQGHPASCQSKAHFVASY